MIFVVTRSCVVGMDGPFQSIYTSVAQEKAGRRLIRPSSVTTGECHEELQVDGNRVCGVIGVPGGNSPSGHHQLGHERRFHYRLYGVEWRKRDLERRVGRFAGRRQRSLQTGLNWFYQPKTTSLVAGQTYKFSFLAALLDTNNNTLDETLAAHVADSKGNPYGYVVTHLTSTWTEYSVQFTPTAANVGNYGIAFLNSAAAYPVELGGGGGVGGSDASCVFGIDRVSLTAVPEPSMITMCVAGLFGLLAYAWRKRK